MLEVVPAQGVALAERMQASVWRLVLPGTEPGEVGSALQAFLDTPEPVLAFVREGEGQRLLAAFNLSDRPATLQLPAGSWTALHGHGAPLAAVGESQAILPPWGYLHAQAG